MIEFDDPSNLVNNFMKQEDKKITYAKPSFILPTKKSEDDI